MNSTILIKKRSSKLLDYQLKQVALVSYLTGIASCDIREQVEIYGSFTHTF